MSDISKCQGTNCLAKEKCYRFTAPSCEFWQSWITEVPFVIDKGKFECKYFYGTSEDLLLIQLKTLSK